MSRNPREVTSKLYEMLDNGLLCKDYLITACLSYMSEADVADMAQCNEIEVEL